MEVDPKNPVIQLCIAGTEAEFRGELDKARDLYQQAWESAQDDHEACIAAHYVARFQDDPVERLRWNEIALIRANAASYEQVREFYPSLFLNIGHSYELLGDKEEAQRYYTRAAALGFTHDTSLDRSA